MRVVILGASGNVGTSVLDALLAEPAVEEVVAVARRHIELAHPKARFARADIARDELVAILRGADAVIHLAWLIQPAREQALVRTVNVTGSERVLQAVHTAGVPALLYASSVGAYSPGPKDRRVAESWPAGGIPSSFYSRHKAAVERMLDRFERDQPQVRVVRMRPALIFKREAATEIRRLFLGPLFPRVLADPRLIPLVPDVPGLRFQVVHSRDVGDAFARAAVGDARGAFNLAAEPHLGAGELASLLRARPLRVPASLLRAGASATFALHLQPSEAGWVDMALAVPLMDTSRARAQLGWAPRTSAGDTLLELLDGIRNGATRATPPLAAAARPARYQPQCP